MKTFARLTRKSRIKTKTVSFAWLKAIADVNRTKDVLEVELEKELLQKEADKNVSAIQNAIIKLAEENLADIEAYKKAG